MVTGRVGVVRMSQARYISHTASARLHGLVAYDTRRNAIRIRIFGFAGAYLSEAFINGERIGCPAHSVLTRFAISQGGGSPQLACP
jgi:hypothetical protein